MLRHAAFLIVILLISGATIASEVGTVASLEAPQVYFTRQAGVYLRHETKMALPQGPSCFLFDFARLDIDPTTLELRVLAPREKVQVSGWQFVSGNSGQIVWQLQAAEAVTARLLLSYQVKGLESEVNYNATLNPAAQTLTLEAQVTLRNTGKLTIPPVLVNLPTNRQLKVSLDPGQSVQQRLLQFGDIPYQAQYLYDNTRFGNSVRAYLRLPRAGSATFDKLLLQAGKIKVFAPSAEAFPTFVAESSIPYIPAHEQITIDLGSVPEITVTRSRLRGDQTNVRTDIYTKLVLFDIEEEYELQIENHRATPLTLTVQEHVPGEWRMIKSTVPGEKLDAGTIEFVIKLDPDQKTKLNYTVKRLNVEP